MAAGGAGGGWEGVTVPSSRSTGSTPVLGTTASEDGVIAPRGNANATSAAMNLAKRAICNRDRAVTKAT